MADSKGAEAMQRIMTVLQVLADRPAHGIDVGRPAGRGRAVRRRPGQPEGLPQPGPAAPAQGRLRDRQHRRRGRGGALRAPARRRPGAGGVLQGAALPAAARRGPGRGRSPAAASREPSLPGAPTNGPLIDDVQVPSVLGDVQRAVASRALVKFDYSGLPRTVHPYGLRMAPRRLGPGGLGAGVRAGQGLQPAADRFGPHRAAGHRQPPGALDAADPGPAAVRDRRAGRGAVLRVSTRFRGQVDAVLHLPLRVEPGPEVGRRADRGSALPASPTTRTSWPG